MATSAARTAHQRTASTACLITGVYVCLYVRPHTTGDVADTLPATREALRLLKQRFGRVFFTPGACVGPLLGNAHVGLQSYGAREIVLSEGS